MLMSVKEVAAALEVSDVTIYNKLKLKEFSEKVVKKGNKAMVDEDLFNLIKDSLNLTKGFSSSLNNDENKNHKATKDEASNDDLSLVNVLVNQLNTKDEQIAKLTKMLEDANAKRDELSGHIAQLLENEQILRREQSKLLTPADPVEEETAVADSSVGNQEEIDNVQPENERKKKWWKIF